MKEIASIIISNVRVQLLSNTLVRLEIKGKLGWEDRPSYLVVNRTDWDCVEYNQTVKSGIVSIATVNYTVVLPINAEKIEDIAILDNHARILWQSVGATTANVFLPSPSDELKSWYFTDTRVIPSANGYNVYDSSAATPLNGWDMSNKAADFFVFLPGGSYRQFSGDYIRLTGKTEMITQQMLGFWDSRWFAYSTESALQQIKDYREKGYGIDMLVIDTDWRAPGGNGGIGYDIDTKLFPDMKLFFEECHKLGVSIVFNDHPEPVSGTINGLDKSEVEYRNNNIKLLLNLGLDTWWYDRNWHTALKTVDASMSVFAFGMYAYQFMTEKHYQSITKIGEHARRPLIMANIDGVLHGAWKYASDIGSHRYPVQWTGDIATDSKALSQEVNSLVLGGVEVGLPYLSSDIGGHTQAVTDEMYIRWFQYGAFSPLLRVHCTCNRYIPQDGRMPWLFGKLAEEVAHKYQDMRYRLMPLLYNLASENYKTGLPLMRRLDINYREFAESNRNDQYLLGDYLLVAPISQANIGGDSRNVFLPLGNWIDIFDGKRYSGTTEINVKHGLETSPIFVREGAILPLAGNGINTQSIKWDKLTLDLYPSIDFDATQNIYEDDTKTVAYKSGISRNTCITMSKVDLITNKLYLNIGAIIGNYTTDFDAREWTIRVHMPKGWGGITQVLINNQPIKHQYFAQSGLASPLANSGAALDSNVYEIVFCANLLTQSNIEIGFSTTKSLLKAIIYDKTEQKFEVVMDNLITYSIDQDAKNDEIYTSTTTVQKELKIKKGKSIQSIELSGIDCIAKLTIRDRSAKHIETITVGSHDVIYKQKVTISTNAISETTLYLTYSVVSSKFNGINSMSYIGISNCD